MRWKLSLNITISLLAIMIIASFSSISIQFQQNYGLVGNAFATETSTKNSDSITLQSATYSTIADKAVALVQATKERNLALKQILEQERIAVEAIQREILAAQQNAVLKANPVPTITISLNQTAIESPKSNLTQSTQTQTVDNAAAIITQATKERSMTLKQILEQERITAESTRQEILVARQNTPLEIQNVAVDVKKQIISDQNMKLFDKKNAEIKLRLKTKLAELQSLAEIKMASRIAEIDAAPKDRTFVTFVSTKSVHAINFVQPVQANTISDQAAAIDKIGSERSFALRQIVEQEKIDAEKMKQQIEAAQQMALLEQSSKTHVKNTLSNQIATATEKSNLTQSTQTQAVDNTAIITHVTNNNSLTLKQILELEKLAEEKLQQEMLAEQLKAIPHNKY